MADTEVTGVRPSYGSVGDGASATHRLVAAMLVLVAVAVGAVILVARPRRRLASGSSPLDLLAERSARGEISPEEYRERRAVLRGERVTSSGSG